MLHIFIPETTPEEKQRKLLRFEEKGNNQQGYGKEDLSNKILQNPFYQIEAGYLDQGLGTKVHSGSTTPLWSSTASEVIDSGFYFEFVNTYIYPTFINARCYGFSRREKPKDIL